VNECRCSHVPDYIREQNKTPRHAFALIITQSGPKRPFRNLSLNMTCQSYEKSLAGPAPKAQKDQNRKPNAQSFTESW
jgi:hypothetical protein